jgi:hypothetical protein
LSTVCASSSIFSVNLLSQVTWFPDVLDLFFHVAGDAVGCTAYPAPGTSVGEKVTALWRQVS